MTTELIQTYDLEAFYLEYIKDKRFFTIRNIAVSFVQDILKEGIRGRGSRLKDKPYYRSLIARIRNISTRLKREGKIEKYNTTTYEVVG